ncbi:hypothetical protein BGZ70_000926 [Mortierella alpina]|uniref:DJ-1/PfpI domain-containing protein n=1 Tax=Mortierella alpina TaxID=64518 RepID=A0A9P6IXA6_MORAP|nr:hypothetical protein BGZ70_000926 [Mortierella alpina]
MVSSIASHGPLPKLPEGAGKLQLGAIVYPGVDLLDLMGPMRIYGDQGNDLDIKINFLACTLEKFASFQQVKVTPDYTIADAPKMDIIFIPGGFGSEAITGNPEVLSRVKTLIQEATWCFTVCNGAGILASTGLVDGYNVTTNKAYFEQIIPLGPKVNWIKRARWVQDGKYVTSSGVSAGMDAALYVVSELASKDAAERVSATIEYTWHRNADEDPFADMYPFTRA